MEILLIGNGFDLEHSLPTSYSNFLEFCKRARRIYTYGKETSLSQYIYNNLDGWEMNNYIKEILSDAFRRRKYKKNSKKGGTDDIEIVTPYNLLDELYIHINNNAWLEFFMDCSSNIGENWIDFEFEISKVIQALDSTRFQVECGGSIQGTEENEQIILIKILQHAKWSLKDAYESITGIDNFVAFLNTELNRLIRALEIYISEIVGKITVTNRSTDIENLNPDHILSFNYSDTYERVYDKRREIKYDYIHGKADINKNVITSNLVLGIDEYLDDNRKDEELEFLTFKKFYQRIYKSTGNDYLDWVDEIKDGYADYLKKKNDANVRIVESHKDGSFDFPYEKNVCRESLDIECPEHTLYIFGHSLDVTDRDILKMFICNDNVQTKIFYYRKNKDDKKVLGKLIRNLIRIMGQDELLRRTGGIHKTIEFIPQTISEEEE